MASAAAMLAGVSSTIKMVLSGIMCSFPWTFGNNPQSSCADLIRVSTSLFRLPQGVDGRVKPGQDEIGESISFFLAPRDFPQTALRFRGNDEQPFHFWSGAERRGEAGGVAAHSGEGGVEIEVADLAQQRASL